VSVGQAALVPVQFSALSHTSAEGRHVTVAALKTSTQVLALPEQWSAASLSHAPPCEVPVQCVLLAAKALTGHAPEVPGHVSATSHWPAESRQVVPAAWKISTQVLLVPVDRKSTRLNSSHVAISYAVFCLKKK